MITTILNAIDDQEQSGRAVDAAIDIARATKASLIFFMANPAVMPARGPLFYRYTSEEIFEYFNQARRRAKFGGVYDVRCATTNCTDIASSILVAAQKEQADYIVVGSDKKSGLLARWKGSISQDVAANSTCPTIIVHTSVDHRVSTLCAAE
jgi:nucleotide-binding universal stress UspA family protein